MRGQTERRDPEAAAPRTWGGKRRGAGRPRKGPHASEPHKKRTSFRANEPLHVRIRVERAVGRLRKRHIYKALREATLCTARRDDFHIVHVSIQSDHLHLLIEAEHRTALAKGMQGFQISAARHINRAISKRTRTHRTGRVFSDRYHVRILRSPRSTRHALAYVLNNWRRHDEQLSEHAKAWTLDPYSTAIQFDGWKELGGAASAVRSPAALVVVWRPKTWLLRDAWRRHGRIGVDEVPGPLANVKERAGAA